MNKVFLPFDEEADQHFQSALLALSDLKRCFEFVEPHELNRQTFSHRFFELLMRGCTEFESIAKVILRGNGVKITSRSGIETYFRLLEFYCLERYFVLFLRWNPSAISYYPFIDWCQKKIGPAWYRDYNKVKHNRAAEFSRASLTNALDAWAGVICLITAAYGPQVIQSKSAIGYSQSGGGYSTHYIDSLGIALGYRESMGPLSLQA